VRQQLQRAEGDQPAHAALVVVTHQASDEALSATVEDLGQLDVVRAVASVMRVEGE
jgi:homoserine dehydrogenase